MDYFVIYIIFVYICLFVSLFMSEAWERFDVLFISIIELK